MLRISPIFILLFVAAAVITAFGIHKYIQHAQMSGQRSLSSEPMAKSGEQIEAIPVDWATKRSQDPDCLSWSTDGVCLSGKEE